MLTTFYILLVFFLVLANGFFVASEFALVGVRRSRIQALSERGNRRAKFLLGLIDNLNAYISATQLGITMASLALGWIGEPVFARLLEAPLEGRVSDAVRHTLAFAIAFTVITFLHIVLGELAPKTLALERAEKVALAIALPLQLFYKVFSWPIRVLDWAGTRTVRLFGLHPSGEHASVYTADELRHLIEASKKSGHLEEENQKLINRVFDFADAEIREAMIPRFKVAALSVDATLEEAKRAFRSHGYSRLPVYRENLDQIVGVLVRRDLEPYLEGKPEVDFKLEELLRPPLFISATSKLGTGLKLMQSARSHIAFVIDEHAGLEGIVTLEDLLEEIVGDISDEYDEETGAQIHIIDGGYLLDGLLAVRDANRRLGLSLPENKPYRTIAGFLLDQAGRITGPGEVIEFEGALFKVESMEGRRIRRIRYTPSDSRK
jgi:CBS domain containing-hemolysin-like protein